MPVISVITAVIDGKHQYLRDTYQSLCAQEMPPGWSWQWVVQEDGQTGRPLAELPPSDPRISVGMARHGRAATARTLALARAEGMLMRTLDADDLLPPGALARDITTLMSHPEVGWCVSAALDLLPDGSLRPGPRDPAPGLLPPGVLAEGERVGLLPVVGTTLCTYTSLVRALGGWQALPADEDVALLLAVEAVADGWMIAEPGLLYRRWEGNSTGGDDHHCPSERAARRAALLDRADALRATGWRWSPSDTPCRMTQTSPSARQAAP